MIKVAGPSLMGPEEPADKIADVRVSFLCFLLSASPLAAGISHAWTPGIRLGLAIFSVPTHTHAHIHASEQKILLLPDNPGLMTLIKKAKYPIQ